MKILMQQADAAGAGAGGAGTGGDKSGQQQAGQQQGASASQAGTQQQAAPAGQATDASKGADADKAKTDVQADIDIKLPDGTVANQEMLSSFKEMAKKGLTPQGVVDFWLDVSAKAAKAEDARRSAAIETLRADAEFGGPKFDQTVSDARSFVAEFGGEEASKEFAARGADVSPGIVKMLARARKAISDDKLVKGKTGQNGESDEDAKGRKVFPNSWDAMKNIAPKRA